MLLKRHLCCALILAFGLYVFSRQTQALRPLLDAVPAAASGSFTEGSGWYPGEPFAHADPKLRAWGSWSGGDENTGTLALGPFPAPRRLRFGIGGYPPNAGNALFVERVDTGQRHSVSHPPVGERWHICEVELPRSWSGHAVRLCANDESRTLGGWLAVTEPIRGGRSDGNNALLETLAAWTLNALVLGVLFLAAEYALARTKLPPAWRPLAAGGVVAAIGYLVYWAYFIQPWLGWVVTSAALIVAGATMARQRRYPIGGDTRLVLGLMVIIGTFHLAALHLFPTQHDFYTLAANRFREALPGDNMLSHLYAERLFAGLPPKSAADEWQSSDRPPLQIGWQLLTWPLGKLLQIDRKSWSGTSAVWLQLLWVAGAYGLLRNLQLTARRAAGWTAAFALSGFFLQNTVFTWPKLSAGAFMCAAFALLFLRGSKDALTESGTARSDPAAGPTPVSSGPPVTHRALLPAVAGIFVALGWLSHGGVAFSCLPLVPFVLARLWRDGLRTWLPGILVFLCLVAPWIAYQKFYDPPGNALLKLHLAGIQARDEQGVLAAMREAYGKLGWRETLEQKASNFHGLVFGNWQHLLDVGEATRTERRNHEFFHIGRGLTWWPVLAIFAVALQLRRSAASPQALPPTSTHATAESWLTTDLIRLGSWIAATIMLWCCLMYGKYTAAIHHGSYAVMLALFVFCAVVLERCSSWWLAILPMVQAVTLGTTWLVANAAISGPPTGLPFLLLSGGVVLAFTLLRPGLATRIEVEQPPFPITSRLGALSTWWRAPHLTLLVMLAFALVMFLRKPHALHTPQLWAEDGSIFLTQNDLHGAAALAMPYMGYLHTLPRLIAWLASRIADPLWWPALYNGAAFVIWLAALCRMFSPRLALPGKPWLALAMIAVPHTGEVYFNITNLQWVTAIVLVQQLLMAPPRRLREVVSDSLILAVLALTGPFALIFAPLFLSRWLFSVWLSRRAGLGRALLAPATRSMGIASGIMVAGAVVQAMFVRTAPSFHFQAAPFEAWPTLVVLARRLFVAPVLGSNLALSLPATAIALAGMLFFVWVVFRAMTRRDLREESRLILGALILVTLAGMYRTRPDTWAADNLELGDRYFYIPRVLLAWLVIMDLNARSTLVAGGTRIICLLSVTMHFSTFTLRAPMDYRWGEHVEAVRRGVPANIPTLPENWTLEYRGRAR